MTLTRIHGFMGHWMNFGGQQMLIFTTLLAFLLLSASVLKGVRPVVQGKRQMLYWLVMAVVATSLVLTFTRGVWLGCIVATVYIVSRWKPRTLWAIPILLAVAYLTGPAMIRRRVSLAFHPMDDPALAIRLEMWRAGLRMVHEHPWVGVGPDNIPLVYAEYLPPGTTPMVGYHDHLHDNFLQLAAERGLPCLAAWLWFMLALGWQILRIRRRLSRQQWVADAAFAAWLAFLAEGFFEYNFGTSPVLMVFLFFVSTPFVAGNLESRTAESTATESGSESG
jgi:O-antigen ligase